MNGRDNVLRALRREEPECIPTFEWDVNGSVLEALIGKNDLFAATEELGMDGIVLRPDYTKEFISEDSFVDEWGCTRKVTKENISIITEHPVKDIKNHKKYLFPDPEAEHRFTRLKKAVDMFGPGKGDGRKAVILNLRDVFSDFRDLVGYENALIALVAEPEYAAAFVDRVVEYNHAVAEAACRRFDIEIIATTDDIAGNRGLILSPETYFAVLAPRFARAIGGFKRLGCHTIKHCDGDVRELIEHWIESGVDCMDPIDPNGNMDLGDIKRRYGDRICLKGNIDCQHVLVSGSPAEVAEAVKSAVGEAGPGGGYILSSSNMIHSGVKPENYRAMLEAVKKYGRYPIAV